MGQLICRETALVTEEERRLHRYVVQRVTDTNQPVLPEDISVALDMPLDQVLKMIEKLEALKVFFYRYNSTGINWAYPVTSDEREYKLTFNSGKECTAA